MKKSRLLEIIREEISSALREGEAEERAAKAAELKAIDAKQKALDAERKDTMKGGALEEDRLNERPFIDSAFDITGISPEDLGKDPLQNAIDNAIKVLKKENPDADVKKLAADIQKVNSPKNLSPNSKLSSEVKTALQKIADVIEKQGTVFGTKAKIDDLIKLTTNPSQIDRLEKLKEKGFTYVIGNPQAVTAVEKSLGLKPKNDDVLGVSKDKPKSEKAPKEKAEKAPKAKVATRTAGDDGFDNVSYSEEDDEVAAATKAISGDETAKELGNTPEEKKVKFNQFLSSVKKNKDDKAKIDGILKLAKDKFKFAKTMMDDLKRAAGREVEA